MKFVLLTNTLNPHMKPLADALYARLSKDFRYIQRFKIDEERKRLGWTTQEDIPYLMNIANPSEEKECRRWVNESDVVLFGANPCMFDDIRDRIWQNKKTFLLSERLFKYGILQFFYLPHTLRYIRQRVLPSWKSNIYILCASAYLPWDYKRIGANTERMFRFGYHPYSIRYDEEALMQQKNVEKLKVLCVGRMINLKHTDDAIKVISRLLKQGYNVDLDIIGVGPYEKMLRALVREDGITEHVNFLGSMQPEKVRKHMEKANIFVFNSDFREGWGAVLNEAMNSGCAVVACRAAGSVPWLIQDGVNGFFYHCRDLDELYQKTKALVEDSVLREQVGRAAYHTIVDVWNADTAAERLIRIAEATSGMSSVSYDVGPMSKANIVKNNWK